MAGSHISGIDNKITENLRNDRPVKLEILANSRKVDAVLISDLKSIRYFCGFTGSSAYLLFCRGKMYFLTDGRYRTQSEKEVENAEIIVYENNALESISSLAEDLGIERLLFESKEISYDDFIKLKGSLKKTELIPAGDEIRKTRTVKDDIEIALLKRAVEIPLNAFIAIHDLIKPGIREIDVALALEDEMRKRGAQKVSFDIIVASGKRSSFPHGLAEEKIIEDHDLVVVDFGAVFKGYNTDETCTVKVGDVGTEALKIYDTVLSAHDKAIEAARPGVTACDVDGAARNYIEEKGYGKFFVHGTGHGVGLDVHELPIVSKKSKDVLEEGMVITVEPGIYMPDIGGVRIEDMVLITASGSEVITKCNNYLRG